MHTSRHVQASECRPSNKAPAGRRTGQLGAGTGGMGRPRTAAWLHECSAGAPCFACCTPLSGRLAGPSEINQGSAHAPFVTNKRNDHATSSCIDPRATRVAICSWMTASQTRAAGSTRATCQFKTLIIRCRALQLNSGSGGRHGFTSPRDPYASGGCNTGKPEIPVFRQTPEYRHSAAAGPVFPAPATWSPPKVAQLCITAKIPYVWVCVSYATEYRNSIPPNPRIPVCRRRRVRHAGIAHPWHASTYQMHESQNGASGLPAK